MEKPQVRIRSGIVYWAIFLATLGVVLIILTTVIFPPLVIRTLSGVTDYSGINPFETGIWTYQLVITDLILLGVVILYLKNKLPTYIRKSIDFIFNFEVSVQVAFVTIAILLGLYIVFSLDELFTEERWADWSSFPAQLQKWSVSDITKGFIPQVKYFLLIMSMNIFGNYKIVPFITSIALLITTYFVTTKITKKRFAGIVSLVIVLQSGTFLTYDSSPTYDTSWVLLYLLSLYLIYKKWPLSPVSFILSVFSKPLTAVFFPMTLFFIYRSSVPRSRKILVALTYAIIVVGSIIAYYSLFPTAFATTVYRPHAFWMAFNAISLQLRHDGLVLLFLLPLTIGLLVASRRKVLHADSILALVLGMALVQPILESITNQASEPYRFIPLIIFFAMGVGTILSIKIKDSTQ